MIPVEFWFGKRYFFTSRRIGFAITEDGAEGWIGPYYFALSLKTQPRNDSDVTDNNSRMDAGNRTLDADDGQG